MSAVWYPEAVIVPGPQNKRSWGANARAGIVAHSAVGYRAGLHSELRRNDRWDAWHLSVMQDGTVEQHYPLDAVVGHGGSDWANRKLIGIEHEGGYEPEDEPLTPAQLIASVALVKWIANECGFELSRELGKKTLWAHNEVSNRPTACPSGRIPWEAYMYVPPEAPESREKPPPAPTPLYQPWKVARFWQQAYSNGATPIRYENGRAVYEIKVSS